MNRNILIFLILITNCCAQNPEWINFTNGDRVFDILCSGNNVWIGTDGGLIKFDKVTNKMSFCNRANANLPDNHVTCTLSSDPLKKYHMASPC
jgi:hypothetical protein